jgi:hypothetical protein
MNNGIDHRAAAEHLQQLMAQAKQQVADANQRLDERGAEFKRNYRRFRLWVLVWAGLLVIQAYFVYHQFFLWSGRHVMEIEQLDSAKDWLKEVCLLGTGSTCCRYLVAGASGFGCAKHDLSMALTINRRVANGTFNAVGDNCKGLLPSTVIPSKPRSQP